MRYRGAWSHGNASVTWREITPRLGLPSRQTTPKVVRPWRTMTDNTELECDRRQDKEVDRRDAVDMIAEKRPPVLRRWHERRHVPNDRRLGDRSRA